MSGLRDAHFLMLSGGKCELRNPKVGVGLQRMIEKSRVGYPVHNVHLLDIVCEIYFLCFFGNFVSSSPRF